VVAGATLSGLEKAAVRTAGEAYGSLAHECLDYSKNWSLDHPYDLDVVRVILDGRFRCFYLIQYLVFLSYVESVLHSGEEEGFGEEASLDFASVALNDEGIFRKPWFPEADAAKRILFWGRLLSGYRDPSQKDYLDRQGIVMSKCPFCGRSADCDFMSGAVRGGDDSFLRLFLDTTSRSEMRKGRQIVAIRPGSQRRPGSCWDRFAELAGAYFIVPSPEDLRIREKMRHHPRAILENLRNARGADVRECEDENTSIIVDPEDPDRTMVGKRTWRYRIRYKGEELFFIVVIEETQQENFFSLFHLYRKRKEREWVLPVFKDVLGILRG
jgi:hypothetical protein